MASNNRNHKDPHVKGNNFQLISQILRGSWLIEQGFANDMMPLVAKMINGDPVSFYDTAPEENEEISSSYILGRESSGRIIKMENASIDEIPPNSIAVIQQRGVVMKGDFCGMQGTASMRSEIIELTKSPKIGAAIIVADSPGGAVNGTHELTDAIYNSNKPIIGFVDGMAASAAYLILSGASEIYASHQAATIGSIGVLVTLRDYTEQLKAMGVKEETFVATTSPNKLAMMGEALAGNPEKLEAYLDKTHAIFMDTVRRTRTEVSDETMDGSIYLAEEALDRDLIDGIATFERVVDRAAELIDIMQKTYI